MKKKLTDKQKIKLLRAELKTSLENINMALSGEWNCNDPEYNDESRESWIDWKNSTTGTLSATK